MYKYGHIHLHTKPSKNPNKQTKIHQVPPYLQSAVHFGDLKLIQCLGIYAQWGCGTAECTAMKTSPSRLDYM
jgi:hypothetical protein